MIDKEHFDVILDEDKDNINAAIYSEAYSTDGIEVFMCKKCFKIHKFVIRKEINYNSRFEILNVDNYNEQFELDQDEVLANLTDHLSYLSIPNEIYLRCDNCNNITDHAILDYNMAEIITELNKKGYTTAYSCDGHYDMRSIPYILFKAKKADKYKYEEMLNLICSNLGYWQWEEMSEDPMFIYYKLQLDINNITISEYHDKVHMTALKTIIYDYLNKEKEDDNK